MTLPGRFLPFFKGVCSPYLLKWPSAIPVLIPDTIKTIEVRVQDLTSGWNSSPPPDFTRDIGTEWVRTGASPVLRVPSAIIPEEHNFVINVKHHDFINITVGDP
jgi:RES domain-containing protein